MSFSAFCRPMRTLLLFLMTAVLFSGCQQQSERSGSLVNNPNSAIENPNAKTARISFTKTEHDFGRLIQGEKVVQVFHFTNTGDADLIISSVSASCGCTASKFTKDRIKPGEQGQIEVTFDSSGQKGVQNKTVTVLCNGQPSTTVLRLKAQVATALSY
mgnify:CR=1 FL=1